MNIWHKSKVATFKKLLKWKKKFRAIQWILIYAQCPLVDFWSIQNFYGKTDHIGKISMVSMCLKHIQSPRRINLGFFHFQMNSVLSFLVISISVMKWRFLKMGFSFNIKLQITEEVAAPPLTGVAEGVKIMWMLAFFLLSKKLGVQ